VKRWFDALRIHRKLVVMALAVTTAALVAATVGLVLLDVWRYRVAAGDDAISVGRIIAENTGAAVVFGDPDAARETLGTVRVRPVITRACVYLSDGPLFAGFVRSPSLSCPAAAPLEPRWSSVVGRSVPIVRGGKQVGQVYVERDLSDLGARIKLTAGAGSLMLLLAAGLAFGLAHRLHRNVSTPISQLAAAARSVGENPQLPVPTIEAKPDEVGELVLAFSGMMERVREANERLRQSNEALRLEVDERTRMQAERETLLAREREASRLKDEFLAAVSHELRTPLNAIIGWVQILSSTAPSEQTTAKALGIIARNAQAQTRVIADLVDVSRIVTGKLNLKLVAMDARTAIEAAVEAIRLAAEAKQITLDVRLPATASYIDGDSDRLQQIVWNLLSNAVKFTPAGGAVHVSLAEIEGAFQIEVADNGLGIAAAFLPHVFERFRQADGSLTREQGGLGLGLAIVQELTELHGGSVRVASQGPETGATFTVRLPVSAAGPAISAHAAGDIAPLPMPLPSLAGVTVLAVDDNVDALEALTTALVHAGACVRASASGFEALAEWDREPADVLVCDLAMPRMDGLEVLRRIRERAQSSGRAFRAIAVSAHAADDYRARSRAAGFDDHIAKPYETSDLVRAVAAVVERA
jgi:signal transduction histidine kinase/CheY-like chemotaxis protein